MMSKSRVLMGFTDFSEIRNNNIEYIDKTDILEDIIYSGTNKVTLITRPRRFGKTLMLNMLSEFFDISKNSAKIFNGLKIANNKELISLWMNSSPVIFISLKNMGRRSYHSSLYNLSYTISEFIDSHLYLLNSVKVSDLLKNHLCCLRIHFFHRILSLKMFSPLL
ncbi:MAG: AAA family ATPase [Desulfovibrionaceae bacterium]|nr:AAA family ATPase [Desulfovibrionaceae bacterium]